MRHSSDKHNILKVGLAVIHERHLMLVRKQGTQMFILPGGRHEDGEDDKAALQREIEEELNCKLKLESICFIGDFSDAAANEPDSVVTIRLYLGQVDGIATPSNEIEEIRWLCPFDAPGMKIAPSIANKILPYLTAREYL